MEIESHINPSTSFKEDTDRPQSSLRIKYAAETQLIINKWGRLEDMRKTLGLSQRKICQLLLVDPSAWSRWTKNPEVDEAPPHIFRALSWYLLLLDKSPELSPYVFLQTVARPGLPETEIRKVTERISDDLKKSFAGAEDPKYDKLLDEISSLQQTNQTQRYWLIAITGLMIPFVLGTCASIFYLL